MNAIQTVAILLLASSAFASNPNRPRPYIPDDYKIAVTYVPPGPPKPKLTAQERKENGIKKLREHPEERIYILQ